MKIQKEIFLRLDKRMEGFFNRMFNVRRPEEVNEVNVPSEDSFTIRDSTRRIIKRIEGGLNLVRGRIIENIHVVPEKIIFTFPDVKLVVEALGDCCSYSYFENTEQLSDLIGQPLTSIEYDRDFTQVNESKDRYNDVSKVHLVKINDIQFQMINESNGWYDGSIDVYATTSEGSRSGNSSRRDLSKRDISSNMTVR